MWLHSTHFQCMWIIFPPYLSPTPLVPLQQLQRLTFKVCHFQVFIIWSLFVQPISFRDILTTSLLVVRFATAKPIIKSFLPTSGPSKVTSGRLRPCEGVIHLVILFMRWLAATKAFAVGVDVHIWISSWSAIIHMPFPLATIIIFASWLYTNLYAIAG